MSAKLDNSTADFLVLNEDCVHKIFQLLDLVDYANLAMTCSQLQNFSNGFSARKYKRIEVSTEQSEKELSKQEFTNVLSVIGKHVFEVQIYEENKFILSTVRRECKNLSSIMVYNLSVPSRQLQAFVNLKELRMCNGMRYCTWKKIFERNPGLEHLDIDIGWGFIGFNYMKLLTKLPQLKSLSLMFHYIPNREIDHLLRLDGVKKLSLSFFSNCNNKLSRMAKMKIVELNIFCPYNSKLFKIIKTFEDVEVLTMDLCGWKTQSSEESVLATAFPLRLKCLKLVGFCISCTTFLEMVKNLQFLEEIDIGSIYYWDRCYIVYI